MDLTQRVGQYLSHMTRPHGRQVLDLVSTTSAGGDDYGSEGLCPNLLAEGLGDFQ